MTESYQYSRNTLMDFIKHRPLDIEICDVTLRDGEQTPGVIFTKEQKQTIASELDSMGIEVMEAGFPVVSEYENERRRKSEFTRGLNVKSVNSAKIVQKARRN